MELAGALLWRRDARLLIVGLAPGLRGANRTGRPFTGDYAGELPYSTLLAFGFAWGFTIAGRTMGFAGRLRDRRRRALVPPENKPSPAEIATCRLYLKPAIAALPRLKIVLALGRIAHESALRALDLKPARFPFAHGARHALEPATLFDSYHCSRYNTNTGVLTEAMFAEVFASIRADARGKTGGRAALAGQEGE